MAIINPTQLPRITREYLDSLKVPGKNFPFEITYANRRKNFALIFSIERELTEAERNTAVDIQIDVAGIPTGQNIQNPIDRPMVHFSYYGKLNDLVQGGRSFEVNVTKCVNEEGNGTLFVAPYVGGKHKTIAVNLTGASTNGGAVIQLLNLATSLNFTRNLQYGNYGPIVEMGEARPHGSLILNSQSKSGWDSVVEPGKFAEWALSFPIGINWDDISNKINIGIIFNNNTKKFYSGLVDNSYNTINGRGGVAGISDVSAMVYDYEIYPTRSRGERAYDRSSPGRLNTRAVLNMEKLFKRTFNLNALTDEEIHDISHIKVSFTLNNDKGTIHFHFYPQRHLSVWSTSVASDIRLSKRSLVFSSYYIRPTKLLEGPELINVPNIDDFRDFNIRKMVRMYSVVDNNQIKIVTPRIDTGQFNNVPGVNVERAAFSMNNMPQNFRSRVNLAKARFFDVVLEDGTILASEGAAPPAPTLFDEVNQVYFAYTARGNSMIVLNCNDGTVVDHVEFVQPDEVSFIINGVPTKNTGLKGYTQSLSLKPNAKPQDIYNNQCTIRVTISKNGRSESKEIELYTADIGRFSGQAMFFAFFEWGAPPVKLNYRDFFHEHPHGRQPILFKVYEENSKTPISETTAKSFYIRRANPVVFYPIGRKLTADYWGMPTALAPDGSSSKIPNIAVINDKSVIEKLSDYSEIGTLFRTNYTTLLVLDKTKNRFEFKLYQYEKTIAKDIEYFIAKNYARPNMAQPTTRLDRMTVFFVDDETGVPSVIGSIKSSETDSAQKAVWSWSSTEELDQYSRQAIDMQPMTYSNTFSMSADTTISRNFRKIMAAGRRGKIAIAFYEPLNNGASERSYWDYKYVYWCRLRDDIVQHTQDSRFLITTGVDDIYTIPKMTDLQITGPGSFTNKLISGGIIYDAESVPSKYLFDHPRYESSSDQPLVASGRLLYDIHRNDDTTFNTSSKPSIPHMFSRGAGFNYNNTTELLVVGINGFGRWEHSVEAIGVIGAGALPTPTPEPGDISSDFESFIFLTDIPVNEAVFAARIKDGVSVEKYGKTVLLNVYNDQGEKIYNELHIKSYRQNLNMRHLGLRGGFDNASSLMSSYLDIELLSLDFVPEVGVPYTTDNAKVIGRLRLNSLTNESEYTDNSIVPNKRFKGVKTIYDNKTVYYRIFGFPSSLKKTGVDPVYILEPDNKLGIVLKDTAFTTGAIDRSINITHDSSKASGSDNDSRPVIRNAINSINGNYEQDYNVLNVSEADNQPREIINAVTQYHIPNIGAPGALEGLRYGLVAMNTQGKGVLYAAMNEHRRTNTSHYLGFTQLPNFNDRFRENPPSVISIGSNETGFSSTNPRSFSLAPLGIAPANVNLWRDGGMNEPVLRHQMTLTNTAPNVTLLKDYNLASGSDSVSYTSYGILKVINTTSSKPVKCTIRLTKTEGNPRVEVLNAQGVSIQNTVGKLICMKPGNDGLVAVEISHGKDSNPIEVPLSHFTKKGNEDKYELLFLIKGHDANADHIIGHAAISLTRNQLKEDSADYDFGLGQILMILNKAGNGVMLKAMVPHGLLTRAEDFVLLNARKPNSVYNVSMETGTLYDIVSIDGVLQDTPQPGSTVLQFGIRKDGELKRSKRITLTQINPSVVSETQDNANGRVYTYDYASVNTSNRIDMKLVKKDNDIHVIFTDSTGKNVTSEVDEFTIVHNSLLSDPSWFGTFILRVSAWQLAGKFNSLTGSYQLPVNNNPHLLKVANLVGSNDKRYGVILVHRSVNDALAAIYHNAGFINTASALPTIGTETGVRYLQINGDGSGFSKVAFGNTWASRPSKFPEVQYFNYTNEQGWVSTVDGDREDPTRLNHMAGSGILPKDIESAEGTYSSFTLGYNANGRFENHNNFILYKDDFVPGLYVKRLPSEYTTIKHRGYVGSISDSNVVPLAGTIKQSDMVGINSDYTIRRNTLVNQSGVEDLSSVIANSYPSRIMYINHIQGDANSGIKYTADVLQSSSVINAHSDNTKMTISPYFNGMLPDVNQDFSEVCGNANRSRDLSEWRVDATVFNALARLNMDEYPIMEITGPNLRSISNDILRIRGPRNKRPIVLNQERNQILTSLPRILVIEDDICFDAAEGLNLYSVRLIPDNIARPTVVIMRGRLILRHRRFADIPGMIIASNIILINETMWDLDQLVRTVVLRDKDSLDPGFDIRRVRRIELTVNSGKSLSTKMYLPKGSIEPSRWRHINLIPPKNYTGGVTDNGGFYTGVTRTEGSSTGEYIYEGGTGQLFGPREIDLDSLKSFIAKDAQNGHERSFRFIEIQGSNPKSYIFEQGEPAESAPSLVSVIDNIERVNTQILQVNLQVLFIVFVKKPEHGELPKTIRLKFQAKNYSSTDKTSKATAEVLLERSDTNTDRKYIIYSGKDSPFDRAYFGRSLTLKVTDLSNQETIVLNRDVKADIGITNLESSIRSSYIRSTPENIGGG